MITEEEIKAAVALAVKDYLYRIEQDIAVIVASVILDLTKPITPGATPRPQPEEEVS